MNRLDFIILSILSRKQARDRLSAMTVNEIEESEELEYKPNTIYKKLKAFERNALVAQGMKEGKAATFYITTCGKKHLGALKTEQGEEGEGK